MKKTLTSIALLIASNASFSAQAIELWGYLHPASDTGVSSYDGITNDSTPEVVFETNRYECVEYSVVGLDNGYNLTDQHCHKRGNSQRQMQTFTLPALEDGKYEVSYHSAARPTVKSFGFEIDTVADYRRTSSPLYNASAGHFDGVVTLEPNTPFTVTMIKDEREMYNAGDHKSAYTGVASEFGEAAFELSPHRGSGKYIFWINSEDKAGNKQAIKLVGSARL